MTSTYAGHPVFGSLEIINDGPWRDNAQRKRVLSPYITRVFCTEHYRPFCGLCASLDSKHLALAAADVAVRQIAPKGLRLAGLETRASRLESLSPIVDANTAMAAQDAAEEMSEGWLRSRGVKAASMAEVAARAAWEAATAWDTEETIDASQTAAEAAAKVAKLTAKAATKQEEAEQYERCVRLLLSALFAACERSLAPQKGDKNE